jgi:hypothetical protein
MGCITLDGKLITCSLEIIEIMLLIPCVMPFFKGKKPCHVSSQKLKKKKKSIINQQWSQPLDYYCYKSKFLGISMGLVGGGWSLAPSSSVLYKKQVQPTNFTKLSYFMS